VTEAGQAGLALLVAVIGYLLNRKANQIHVLVNSQMVTALARIDALEKKLGLSPGEAIPAPSIVTTPTTEETT
jgi:hypothetical protein